KTRVIASSQHVVRIDKESKENVSSEIEEEIINFLNSIINDIDAIILQDYNKGVLTDRIIIDSISISNRCNKIIAVDPKFINFKQYQNATIFKPNKRETENILGMRIESDEDISKAGNDLLTLMNAKYVLLTLGEKGIALFERGRDEVKIPTKARKVADVSGAGDTVISTITFALCAGASIEEAAYIANYAGGLVCEEVGIVPISKNKLFDEILSVLQ
ncbi:MAG: PfkB family carbohydrate kinase, partial [Melioribacteraceae bacterium]|nr:PfkB family carbohydrate kinase [Melioribacteraceae bacterium]